ncbi:MAG: hypothetical protein JRI63_10525 [Deltaproteobacteria bacterium]|nr:hypothetical protein [Deltaproteobacteria bacterium]
MLKFIKKISQKAGSAPGTLVHIGERKIEKPRIRKNGCDYLAYALIDAVIDHYFVILESISATIESLEEERTKAQTYLHAKAGVAGALPVC